MSVIHYITLALLIILFTSESRIKANIVNKKWRVTAFFKTLWDRVQIYYSKWSFQAKKGWSNDWVAQYQPWCKL